MVGPYAGNRKCIKCGELSYIQGVCGHCLEKIRIQHFTHPEFIADHGRQQLRYKKCKNAGCTFDAIPKKKECEVCSRRVY